jgi:hypothetical protein
MLQTIQKAGYTHTLGWAHKRSEDDSPSKPSCKFRRGLSCQLYGGNRKKTQRVERWKTDEQRSRQGGFQGCSLHALNIPAITPTPSWSSRGGGQQTKKKDRTQVLKLDKSAGPTPAVRKHGHRLKSPKLRCWVEGSEEGSRRTWLAMQ